MVAANKIEKNSISAAILAALQFGLLYLLFRSGLGPIWARYVGIIFVCVWSFLIKPYILWKDINYTWNEMGRCIVRCLKILFIDVFLCLGIYFFLPQNSIYYSLLVASLSIAVVSAVSLFNMPAGIRKKLYIYIKTRINEK